MANALVQSLANALGKCPLVVDRSSLEYLRAVAPGLAEPCGWTLAWPALLCPPSLGPDDLQLVGTPECQEGAPGARASALLHPSMVLACRARGGAVRRPTLPWSSLL